MIEWKKTPIEDVCSFVTSGGTPPTGNQDYYYEGTIPWLTTTDIHQVFISKIDTFITELGLANSSAKMIPANSVIVAMYGETAGKVGINKIPLCTNQACCNLVIDPELADYLFVFYSLRLNYPNLLNLKQGGAQQNLNAATIRAFEIPLPPLPLQRRIATVLGRYDALLENYQQQVAALEGLALEVYQEWFVRGRCPGAEAGPEGELPSGWRAGKLRDIVAFYIGGGWGQEEPDDEHTISGHVVRGTDIPNLKKGTANLDVYRYHKASNMNSRELQAGDIVFEVSGGSKDQGLGRNVLLTKQLLNQFGDKVMAASFCKLIRPNQEITSAYYLQQLLDYLLENQEMAQYEVQSTGISNFQFEDFLDFQKVILPAKESLNRFDKIVAPIYQKLAVLSTQAAVLRATRDALLPRLLSGQLTVHEAEATLTA